MTRQLLDRLSLPATDGGYFDWPSAFIIPLGPTDNPKLFTFHQQEYTDSICWRNYGAHFKIINGKLYLIEVFGQWRLNVEKLHCTWVSMELGIDYILDASGNPTSKIGKDSQRKEPDQKQSGAYHLIKIVRGNVIYEGPATYPNFFKRLSDNAFLFFGFIFLQVLEILEKLSKAKAFNKGKNENR